MIAPGWALTMARYNTEMNRRIYAHAAGLDDAARRAERGLFFGSLHRTLSHLLWADHAWMARFAGWPAPGGNPAVGAAMHEEWEAMRAVRAEADAAIEAWAAGVTQPWLDAPFTWTNSQGITRTMPAWLLVTHMFNHQTHHRGQAHAALTAAGVETDGTDLPWIVEV